MSIMVLTVLGIVIGAVVLLAGTLFIKKRPGVRIQLLGLELTVCGGFILLAGEQLQLEVLGLLFIIVGLVIGIAGYFASNDV